MRIRYWSSDVCSSDLVRPEASSFGEPSDKRRGILPATAHCLDVGVELIDERRDRQPGAIGTRLLERETEVLAHPVDGEAEVELALVHRLPAIDHLPALRRAAGDRLEYLAGVEPGRLGEMKRFGKTLELGRATVCTPVTNAHLQ